MRSAQLFDFDLNNGLSLDLNEFLQLPMAYVDTMYEWDTSIFILTMLQWVIR